MKKIICMIPLLLSLLFSGCVPVALVAGAAAGIAGYKYFEGALTVVYNAPFKNTWKASLEAIEGMELKIEDQNHKLSSGKIKARRTDDTVVAVSMKYLSSDQTEVTIKVGLFGDEAESNNIKDKITGVLFK
jgi:uncharacterized lipoprotein